MKNHCILTNFVLIALRLYPPLPHNARVSLKDLILPVGGGKDGQSPVFVPAGTEIKWHLSALHQRKDLWGEDADEFRPERFEGDTGSWVRPTGGPPCQETSALCTFRIEANCVRNTCHSVPGLGSVLAVSCCKSIGKRVRLLTIIWFQSNLGSRLLCILLFVWYKSLSISRIVIQSLGRKILALCAFQRMG